MRPTTKRRATIRARVEAAMANPAGKLRGPNGRRLCRWCGTEVPTARQSWCSGGACVDAYKAAAWPASTRRAVFARDLGVCALCGVDTATAERRVAAADTARWAQSPPCGRTPRRDCTCSACHLRAAEISRGVRAAWDADHVVPIVEGGGVGLDNLRTLCRPCHKVETARLAGRMATARRAQPELPLVADGSER